jgi:hypothetical protein
MINFRSVGIGLVFLVGCAVGGAASRFVVPPASAQQAATQTRWEYFCFFNNERPEAVAESANRAGSQGWEMVTSGSQFTTTWCFKRPLTR